MRTFFTILLAATCIVASAQKKPKINQALKALEDGELAEAKMIIDAAIEHEKTKDDPKTWFYRGQIYTALDTANNEPGAIDEALKAYNKTLELDPEQKSVNSIDFTTGSVINVDSKLLDYYTFYYNKAIAAYNSEAYGDAADNFETAFYINPKDTNAVLNAAYASMADGDNDGAESYFEKAYEAGVRDKNVFLQLYNYAAQKQDFEKALAVIKKGRAAYPEDLDLARYEINVLIQLKRSDEAKAELEKAIAADPQNADLHFSLGVLREELGDIEGAMESYNAGIDVDPNHFNSNFNKGVLLFNKANEMIKERNALSYKEKAKTKALSVKINEQLEASLPVWEKLYSLNSKDQTVLETLAYIYNSLGNKDKAEKMNDELDNLK